MTLIKILGVFGFLIFFATTIFTIGTEYISRPEKFVKIGGENVSTKLGGNRIFSKKIQFSQDYQEAQDVEVISSKQFKIKAKTVKTFYDKNLVELYGEVHLEGQDLFANSDEAKVFFSRTMEVEKIHAYKNVFVRFKDVKVFADTMNYFADGKKIYIEGNPKIWKGNTFIQGDKIIVNLENKSVEIQKAKATVETE